MLRASTPSGHCGQNERASIPLADLLHTPRTQKCEIAGSPAGVPSPLMEFQRNVALAAFTTFEIGGPAAWFAEARTEADIEAAVAFAQARSLRLFVLGGGSNVLISDAGFNGLVLRIALCGIEQHGILLSVAAGEDWDAFVARSVDAGLAGVECLSGIPGTVGGTPVQNVGAYGQEVSETIRNVRVCDIETHEIRTLSNGECGFAYRSSIFNTSQRGRYIILRVSFALRQDGAPTLRYAELQPRFADRTGAPSLAEVRVAVREIRYRKAMLIVPGDEDARSAGSVFKNPVVAQTFFDELSQSLDGRGFELPS